MPRTSIFEELNKMAQSQHDKKLIVENRADHIITSAINLFEYIDSNYTDDQADQLMKRFISSIRGKDPKRFSRAIAKVENDQINK